MEECTLNKEDVVMIKIGSNVLASQTEGVKVYVMQSLATQTVWLPQQGKSPIVISSGAVSCGGSSSSDLLEEQKVAAMVGQIILMNKWQEVFSQHGVRSGQILCSHDDLRQDELIRTLRSAIAKGIIPIINENDPVATEELVAMREHGDNDRLAAIAAINISASRLIILTDVDGLYAGGSPKCNNQARLIRVVPEVTDKMIASVKGSESDKKSGMACKLAAIKEVTEHGIECQLANGNRPNVIPDLFGENPPGTFFNAQPS